MFTREATKKEIAHYKKVEKLTANYTDEEYDNLLEIVSDFCYDLTGKVGTYTKIKECAKQMGIKVKTLVDWYMTEENIY